MIRLFVAAIIVALIAPALAHDAADWIQRERHINQMTREWCCGVSDCQIVEDVTEVGGGYRVRLTVQVPGTPNKAKFIDIDEIVPFSEAPPSPDGKFWRCRRPDGSRRCFFAPPVGM